MKVTVANCIGYHSGCTSTGYYYILVCVRHRLHFLDIEISTEWHDMREHRRRIVFCNYSTIQLVIKDGRLGSWNKFSTGQVKLTLMIGCISSGCRLFGYTPENHHALSLMNSIRSGTRMVHTNMVLSPKRSGRVVAVLRMVQSTSCFFR